MSTVTSPVQPNPPTPGTALPQLPISKLRIPSSTSELSKTPSASSSTPRTGLRTPSKTVKPPLLNASHALSSPDIQTLSRRGSQQEGRNEGDPAGESVIRRSVSIANFPQPPKVRKAGQRSSADTDGLAQTAPAAISMSNCIGVKQLKTKASTGSLNQMYSGSATPNPFNGSGHGKALSGPTKRESSGFVSVNSQPRSPDSSAEESCSTSATTFEDSDEKRRSKERSRGRDSRHKDKESKGNVLVSVRVRPDAGGDKNSGKDWLVDARQSLVAYKGRGGGDYLYDNVFAPYEKNHRVYDSSAKRLVRRVMEGYHGTVFAYGMTGTGKTFSMQGTRDSPGVIPLAITDLFSYIRETPSREFLLRVSYLEIYNEKINDLLTPPAAGGVGAPQQEEIKLREDSKRGVFASPLKEEIVQSPTQLLRVIARGDQCRKTRSTQFNAQSSRSHAVVQIVVESRDRAPVGGKANDKRSALTPGGVRVSTLSMIDLAGSERAADNKERQKEGAHINKSLLTLGTIISKLSGETDSNGSPTDKEGKHLPYRDSKLTRLLQPALSGTSLISILCTIQIGSAGSVVTANGHTGETLNTLKFASRAKNNIVSHAKKAEEALGAAGDGGSRVLLERYRMEIQDLRGQLEAQKKDQAQKEEIEEKEQEMGVQSNQRREDQLAEINLARIFLEKRMDDLRRLILSSQSVGVNVHSKSLGLQSSGLSNRKNDSSPKTHQSLRSSTSHSTLGKANASLSRNVSMTSSATVGREANDLHHSPISSYENDDEEDLGQETASAHSQIRSLQADLIDKTRYIETLEKRLLQARRSSHSRTSLLLSPTVRQSSSPPEEGPIPQVIQEKDAEIAELLKKLDDKDRMLNALRSVARNRDIAIPPLTAAAPPEAPGTITRESAKAGSSLRHQSNGSGNSTNTASSSGQSGLAINTTTPHKSPVSPVQLLSPQKDKEKDSKRKSIDGLTRILDGMIQDRVQTGGLVMGANGIVRPAHDRSKQSLGAVPSVGALAAQLRPVGTLDD